MKPVNVAQLVAASGDMQRLVNLATLSDSLDYLADAMQHFGDSQHTRHSALVAILPVPEAPCVGNNDSLFSHSDPAVHWLPSVR